MKLSNVQQDQEDQTSASRKAKPVLLQLSAKSLDEPAKEVVNVSSSNLVGNLFHFFNTITNSFARCKTGRNSS